MIRCEDHFQKLVFVSPYSVAGIYIYLPQGINGDLHCVMIRQFGERSGEAASYHTTYKSYNSYTGARKGMIHLATTLKYIGSRTVLCEASHD